MNRPWWFDQVPNPQLRDAIAYRMSTYRWSILESRPEKPGVLLHFDPPKHWIPGSDPEIVIQDGEERWAWVWVDQNGKVQESGFPFDPRVDPRVPGWWAAQVGS